MRQTYICPPRITSGLAVVALLLTGCTAPLESDLTETQANEMLVALHAGGISAEKLEVEGSAGDLRFEVRVPSADEAPALSILAAEGLPRRAAPGVAEVFGEGGLVPTPTEERARYLAAVAGELSRTLQSIDGVVSARVHVATPEGTDLGLDSPSPGARASVFVKHRADAAPPEEAHIRSIVAGAVAELSPDAVRVVILPSAPAASPRAALVRLGPLTLTEGSATTLRLMIAGVLVVLIALAAALMTTVARSRRRGFRRPIAG